jgi:competence protein ComEC
MFWNRYPFLRILLAFLSGILLPLYTGFTQPLPVYVPALLFLIYSVLIIAFQQKLSYRLRWITGLLIFIFFMMSGYQLKIWHDAPKQTQYFGKFLSEKAVVECILTEPMQEKEKTCKAVVEITAVSDSSTSHHTSGKAIIYLQKDSLSQKLVYGDKIILCGKFRPVNPPMNPGEFDYRTYLHNRSIEFSAFIKTSDWKWISSGNGNPIQSYAYSLRQKLLNILDQRGISGSEYAVISALLVGYTDKIDADLIRDYQGSGAMHILSVSGMHVGIIYLFLNFLLFFFDKFKYGRAPKAVILILFVWSYAILTGLSPAVMRASTMFTFIAFSNAFRYPPNLLNTLAASAFTLLVFDPYFITDIGFQLSYLSVLGIILIYPVIYQSWGAPNRLLNKIWALIAVSLATQIVTFPLSMFYFHQFPNYFILTNLVAVPWSAVVIYLGIACLVFHSVPFLSVILSKALTWSLIFLNGCVSFIEGLPYSVSGSISITPVETLLIYLAIGAILLWFSNRTSKWVFSGLVFLLIFAVSFSFRNMSLKQERRIIVYNIAKHTAIDFINGNSCYFVADSSLRKDTRKMDFFIKNSRIKYQTKIVNTFYLPDTAGTFADDIFYKKDNFISFAGKRMAIVNSKTVSSDKITVDFLLITHNTKMSPDEILQQFRPGLIILDASNNRYYSERLLAQCRKRNIACFSTSLSGAWILKIKYN